MRVVVGTRGSKLALTQTQWVIDQLRKYHPEVEFEVKIIKTKGDLIQHVSLDKIGDKGLFVREIEQQLLDKEIDIAVHSMKDMPSKLPKGAKIGTGSKRRKYQLLKYRPDLDILSIRGNIDTRIRKIEDENLDGIVLAAAGILRAGMSEMISSYIPVDIMVPAPAQGALAIQIREADLEIEALIESIKDVETEIRVAAERAFLAGVNGGCHIPMGAYCELEGEKLKLTGLYGSENGNCLVRKCLEGGIESPIELGLEVAQFVLKEYDNYER